MPNYRIYRMNDGPRETFRWAAHTGGVAVVKSKDYEPSGEIEAATPYAAWKASMAEANPVRPGDLLECISADGVSRDLRIAKYIGFEPAQWYVPELRTDPNSAGLPSDVAAES